LAKICLVLPLLAGILHAMAQRRCDGFLLFIGRCMPGNRLGRRYLVVNGT
jgi:hypothetical protein